MRTENLNQLAETNKRRLRREFSGVTPESGFSHGLVNRALSQATGWYSIPALRATSWSKNALETQARPARSGQAYKGVIRVLQFLALPNSVVQIFRA